MISARLIEVRNAEIKPFAAAKSQPVDVQAQWSIDGHKWSDWQSMGLKNPPDDVQGDSRRLRYSIEPHKAKYINYVRLRFVCLPELPVWHTYSSQPSWLMIDEVEIRKK